jgi:hypothetical protein
MKFWNFMFGAALLAAVTAVGLVLIGAAARMCWLCVLAGWHLVGLVFP